MFLTRLLHLTQSCASSPDNSLSDKSFLMLSNHLRYRRPLLLAPGTSITITLLPTYSYSLPNTCSYDFNLLSHTFLDISPTFVVPLILSFLLSPILRCFLALHNSHTSLLHDVVTPCSMDRYSEVALVCFHSTISSSVM